MLYSTLFAGFVLQSAAFEDFEIDIDDHINLLQVQAKKNNRTEDLEMHLAIEVEDLETDVGKPVNHKFVFDSCATFGGAADIVGTGAFNPINDKFDYCRSYGLSHYSAVPFDVAASTVVGRSGIISREGWADNHYQYNAPGVSRMAKAVDGSWEIQVFQCGYQTNFHPTGQVGTAIKVGGTVIEVGVANRRTAECRVNGELKPPGYEVHLPTGFHFRCPASSRIISPRTGRPFGPNTPMYGTFCGVMDGQFVATTNQLQGQKSVNQVLGVAKNVDVQVENTICYDPASKNTQETFHPGRGMVVEPPGMMANTAIVPADEVIFSQAMLDYMSYSPRPIGVPGNRHYHVINQCLLQTPPQSAVPAGDPVDPEVLCNEKGPTVWQHVQDVCSPLQEKHAAFYADCLVDECLRADEADADSEEATIEEIADADEPIADEASAQGDPHITSSGGATFDVASSMLKHHHD